MSPLVSIVVPFYKGDPLKLRNCINSILCQDYSNIEIVLIDDGAEKVMKDMAKKISEAETNIKLYSKENGGVSSARNLGIAKSRGDYIVFIDSDDAIERDFISAQVQRLGGNRLTLVGGSLQFEKSNRIRKEIVEEIYIKKTDITPLILGERIHGTCCRYVFDLNYIKKYNIRFRESLRYMEDAVFVIEYCENAKIEDVRLLPVYYRYIENAESATHDNDHMRSLSEVMRSLEIINEITEDKYRREVNDCRIRFWENSLLECPKKEIASIFRKYHSSINMHYYGKKNKYRIFIFFVKTNNITIIRIYRFLRNTLIRIPMLRRV